MKHPRRPLIIVALLLGLVARSTPVAADSPPPTTQAIAAPQTTPSPQTTQTSQGPRTTLATPATQGSPTTQGPPTAQGPQTTQTQGPLGPQTASDPPAASDPQTAQSTQTDGVAHDGDTQVLHDDYERVLAQEADLLRNLADVVHQRQGAELSVYNLDVEITKLSQELGRAQTALDAAVTAEDQAATALRAAQARVDRAAAELHQQLANSYVHGGTDTEALEAVFDLDGHDRSGESLTYSHAVVNHQHKVIADFRRARGERDRQAKMRSAARLEAEHKRSAVVDAKAKLERDKYSQVVAVNSLAHQQLVEQLGFLDLDHQKADIVAKVVGLQREADGLSDEANRFQAAQPDFKFPDTALVDPVPGSVYTQSFGPQKLAVGGVVVFHPGIDLAGPVGTPIHAAAEGVVIRAGPLGGYGNAVIIDHGAHLATLYGHQSAVLVQVGQPVKQGDIIGLRGSTGFSTGPHVHFETRVNGVPVDPLLFIRLGVGFVPPTPAALALRAAAAAAPAPAPG